MLIKFSAHIHIILGTILRSILAYMNNILQDLRVYLCGQIENDPDAAGWRKELAQKLVSIEPTLKVWDPMIKPNWVHSDVISDAVAFKWKQHVIGDDEKPEFSSQESKGTRCFNANVAVRRICKQLANKCDIFVARISKTFTWGSIDELEIAISRRIPIFVILPDGLISIYGLAGMVRSKDLAKRYIHFNVDSLLETLDSINSGEINIVKEDPETWMRLSWVNAAEIDNA